MPRIFVNAVNDFIIQGGMVSFALADQAMKIDGGKIAAVPPEDVARVTMREQDFAALVDYLNARVADFEREAGRKLGGDAR